MNLEVLSINENQDLQNAVIDKIRELINYKNLEPNDKLPSERMLSDKLGVSRGVVRDAIQKLEFYGLLKSIPQSGTFVANVGGIAMNGIVDDILRLEEPDFKSLVETRILLELKTVRLASLRRTDKDLKSIKEALDAYEEKVLSGKEAVQEDLLFHLSIAKASKNSSINTFMLTITPQIIIDFGKYHVCDNDLDNLRINEHRSIYEAIKKQDPVLAKQRMKEHFKVLYQYCYNVK
ncbi:FadR/GntR family transcriptional regulator [Mariniflexile sp. AS56]|uniref:FadR/GntR family transcriptional regulator n=1 Tax=Mariniflexile sp. AS56 TaxID=3063957 RepID=UPI0026ECA24D|nr:FadR/GntR family transcriptional regulator [Mariniflexile sp. AS56]MDO7173283.1 FadR/GntR family transcriptional regulator [Mariniflexile sp. AS56]